MFEGVAHQDLVRIDLEAPYAIANLIQKVRAGAFVVDQGGGTEAGDPPQRFGVARWGMGGAGVHEGIRGVELAQVFRIADAEIPECQIVRIAAVALHSGQSSQGFGGDGGTDGFARCVNEVEKMSLPAKVEGRRPQHVVGEHGGGLRTDRAEGPGHRRIQVAREEVGLVELVDDAGSAVQLRAQHVGIGVDGLEEIAL